MTATTRPGYEWWDRLGALPKYSFLLSFAGNAVRRVEDKVGNWIEYSAAQAVVDGAQDEINALRQIISDCAAAVGNGTGVGPTCSLDFMRLLPDEIRAELASRAPAASRAAPADAQSLLDAIRRELDHAALNDVRLPPDLGRTKGARGVRAEHIEAAIEGWKKSLAALASREAIPAPLTDEQIDAVILSIDHKGRATDDMSFLRDLVRAAAALASPQVAPDPYNACQSFEMYKLVVRQNSSLLKQIEALEDQLAALAAPVQVAPTMDNAREAFEGLFSCPFCGADAHIRAIGPDFGAGCDGCGAEAAWAPTEELAAAAWNRRAAPVQVAPTMDNAREAFEGLFSCPFCGADAHIRAIGPDFGAGCDGCGAEAAWAPTEELAAAAWNRRAAPVQVAPTECHPDCVFHGSGVPCNIDCLPPMPTPAAADDARDAAEVEGSSTVLFELVKWSEEAVKLLRSEDHEVRDRLRSALNALSTPAAKPAEPTLPTQGEQSHD